MTTSDQQSEKDNPRTSPANAMAGDDGPGTFAGKEGSPILIGGGSVNINFREGSLHYQPVAGSPGTYKKINDEIDTVLIVDGTGILMNNLLSVVRGKMCDVTIHTEIAGGASSAITV